MRRVFSASASHGHLRRDNICDVPGVLVGHATDAGGVTGCTAVLFETAAVAGVDVRGPAPGTQQTDALDPTGRVGEMHAVLLTGGSAAGLAAAAGVVGYLKERGVGYDVGVARVPIVPAAVFFDLGVGDPEACPGPRMGHEAASSASSGDFAQGSVGAGTGATVGKALGMGHAMRGGLGSVSKILPGGLVVGALAVANALGDVREPSSGEILAGPRRRLLGRQRRVHAGSGFTYSLGREHHPRHGSDQRPPHQARDHPGGSDGPRRPSPRRLPRPHLSGRRHGLRRLPRRSSRRVRGLPRLFPPRARPVAGQGLQRDEPAILGGALAGLLVGAVFGVSSWMDADPLPPSGIPWSPSCRDFSSGCWHGRSRRTGASTSPRPPRSPWSWRAA